MKDFFLILIVLTAFAFGYYIMTRVDRFMEDSQLLIAAENRKGQSRVRIAAESPVLLESVASALESCSNADPHLSFFLSSGNAGRILEKLLDESIDIVLLRDADSPPLDEQYASLCIPCEKKSGPVRFMGMPVEDLDEDAHIRVVWKRSVQSKDRARVLFALENEHCRLKCGYADYLDR